MHWGSRFVSDAGAAVIKALDVWVSGDICKPVADPAPKPDCTAQRSSTGTASARPGLPKVFRDFGGTVGWNIDALRLRYLSARIALLQRFQ